MDGSSNKWASGARIILTSLDDQELQYALRFDFKATNNEAEYEVVLAGVSIVHFSGVDGVVVRSDPQLVVGQVKGEFVAKDSKMKKYLLRVLELKSLFKQFSIEQIPQEANAWADTLAQMASNPNGPKSPDGVLLEVLPHPSIWYEHAVYQVNLIEWWREPIVRFLEACDLPTDRAEAWKLRIQAAQYTIQANTLYKKGFSKPLLWCLAPKRRSRYFARFIKAFVETTPVAKPWLTRLSRRGIIGRLY